MTSDEYSEPASLIAVNEAAVDADGQRPCAHDGGGSVSLAGASKGDTEDTNGATRQNENTAGLTLARLLKLEEVVRGLAATQKQRCDTTERHLDTMEKTIIAQIQERASNWNQAVSEVETRFAGALEVLTERIEAVESARIEAERREAEARLRAERASDRQEAFRQAWNSAPLTLRLRFVKDLLPGEGVFQNTLKEAAALEELRGRGSDLETWLTTYPSLFADAAWALDQGVADDAGASGEQNGHSAEMLAVQTVKEARAALETTLQALGITWIAPVPGAVVTAEHEVLGEEISSQAVGRIARLSRRGFRVRGRLMLPAQVFRSIVSGPASDVKEEQGKGALEGPRTRLESIRSSLAQPVDQDPLRSSISRFGTSEIVPGANADLDLPDWLRMLGQRTFGCDIPAVSALVRSLESIPALSARVAIESNEDTARQMLTEALSPLVPLLGLRYADGLPEVPEVWGAAFLEAREPFTAWLGDRMGVRVIAPSRGARFDPEMMDAMETRRTVHANENGTITKADRVGLLWRGRPLMRAQVVRYISEGNS